MFSKVFSKWRQAASQEPVRARDTSVGEGDFTYIAQNYQVHPTLGFIPWLDGHRGPWKMERVAWSPRDQLTGSTRGRECGCRTCLAFLEKHPVPLSADQACEHTVNRNDEDDGNAEDETASRPTVAERDTVSRMQVRECSAAQFLQESNEGDALAKDYIEAVRCIVEQGDSTPLRRDNVTSHADRQDSVTSDRPKPEYAVHPALRRQSRVVVEDISERQRNLQEEKAGSTAFGADLLAALDEVVSELQ